MTHFEIRSLLTETISEAIAEGWAFQPKTMTAVLPPFFRIDLSKSDEKEILRIELEEKSAIRWENGIPAECTVVILTKSLLSPIVYDNPPLPFRKWFSCSSVFVEDQPKIIEKRVFYQTAYDMFIEEKK